MPKPIPERDANVAELLLTALESLPEQQRRQVLTALIERGLAMMPSQMLMQTVLSSASSLAAFFGASKLEASDTARLVPLPVRLPARDYERPKAWSARHEFPMAVVIGGLVERFLDSQEHDPHTD
jgi:hypothetical protein